jgi:hypothetical protein
MKRAASLERDSRSATNIHSQIPADDTAGLGRDNDGGCLRSTKSAALVIECPRSNEGLRS